MISREKDVDKYSSLYPYAHIAFFLPLNESIGVYAGAGGGLWMVSYKLPEGDYSDNLFAAAAIVGMNLFDMIDVSYACRTNFSNVSHKVSIGYTYRFLK